MEIFVAAAVFAAVSCGTYSLLEITRARARRTASLQQLAEYGEHEQTGPWLLDPLPLRIALPVARWATRLGRAFTPAGHVERLRTKLTLAGKPKPNALDRSLAAQVICLIGGLLAASAVGSLLHAGGSTRWGIPVLLVAAAALGPRAALNRTIAKRQKAIRASLPNAVDLLAVSVEAGFGLDQALERVSLEATGPLAEELRRVQGDMRAGASRAAAMRALLERTDVAELRSFVSAVLQAEVFGVPIAPVLRAQSEDMRIRRRQRAQTQAQKAPVKMLIPTVFCIFPALFVVVLGPAFIKMGSAFG